MTPGRLAKLKREFLGLSIESVAARVGCTRNQLLSFEAGRTRWPHYAPVLARALDIDTAMLRDPSLLVPALDEVDEEDVVRLAELVLLVRSGRLRGKALQAVTDLGNQISGIASTSRRKTG